MNRGRGMSREKKRWLLMPIVLVVGVYLILTLGETVSKPVALRVEQEQKYQEVLAKLTGEEYKEIPVVSTNGKGKVGYLGGTIFLDEGYIIIPKGALVRPGNFSISKPDMKSKEYGLPGYYNIDCIYEIDSDSVVPRKEMVIVLTSCNGIVNPGQHIEQLRSQRNWSYIWLNSHQI